MKDSIRRKLEKLDERFEEISRLLSDAGVISRQNQFRELSMEYSKLGPLVDRYRRFIGFERESAHMLLENDFAGHAAGPNGRGDGEAGRECNHQPNDADNQAVPGLDAL